MSDGTMVGILLAAGASRRLGRPKQTLPFGDTTLLGWTLRQAEASSLERIIVVTGAAAAEVTASLQPKRAEVVLNPDYVTGSNSSLQAGIQAAGDCQAVMHLLGDMPGVDAEVIDTVKAGWLAGRPWAAMTRYQDGDGHPFVLSSAAFAALEGRSGDKVLWELFHRDSADRVGHIPVPRPKPADVNTWDDYVELCSAFGFIPPDRDTASS